jgi:hypothetical protein
MAGLDLAIQVFPLEERVGEESSGAVLPGAEPIRMAMFGKHVDIVARLETPEQFDELIRRLRIGKALLTPLDSVKKPESDEAAN